MKYFTKTAVSITTSNKVDVAAPTKGLTLQSRTTPTKTIKAGSGVVPKQKVQQPKPSGKVVMASLRKVSRALAPAMAELYGKTKSLKGKNVFLGDKVKSSVLSEGFSEFSKHDKSAIKTISENDRLIKEYVGQLKAKGVNFDRHFAKHGSLREDWENLKYVTKHKAYIIRPGRQLGLGYVQLLKHDMSKFRPAEWNPYKKHLFGTGNGPETGKAFRNAVATSHYRRNPHHRESPLYSSDIKYKLEEVVDWYAASKAQASDPAQHPTFKQWYLQRRDYFLAHPIKPVDPLVDQHIINTIH